MKKYFLGAAVVVGFLAVGLVKADAAPPAGFVDQTVLSGLAHPTDYAFAPDGRILITLISGQVLVYKNGGILATPALSLASTTPGIAVGGDRGLMSLALDPNFSSNGYIYLLHTTAANHERISRFTFNGDTVNPASEQVLLENSDTWSGFLNAGALRYNPIDGKLYATMGSNGGGSIAQDLSSLTGKLVRINLDGSIPADNPFVNTAGAQAAIWSSGFRNPWHMNIDPQTGAAMIGDVGENTWEKVVRSAKGANFGWPTFEGDCKATAGGCGGITPPIYVYNHNGQSAAIDGGTVYQGSNFPSQYSHSYFYGDFVQGWVGVLNLDASGNVTSTSTFDSSVGTTDDLATFASGPDGCLYSTRYSTGGLHRYCYNGAGGNPPPTSLSSQAVVSGQNIITTVNSNLSLNKVLVDTEIWNSSGKVSQNFVNVANLSANSGYTTAWSNGLPTTPGSYTIKIGIFSSDWSKLYNWNDTAATAQVSPTTPPPLSFVVSAALAAGIPHAGASSQLTSSVTATENLTNVNIDTEIYDSTGKQFFQTVTQTNLAANQQFSNNENFTLPNAQGLYTVKIGVFSPDWSTLYFWQNRALQFFIGTPPGAPQPGQTYNINLIYPVNGQTVSGTQEIKANINGLDINTYTIGWRTGSGGFFILDPDPVSQAYQHAWIDFTNWNWNPNNVYPLEFQAKDQSGSIIGDSNINVTVIH